MWTGSTVGHAVNHGKGWVWYMSDSNLVTRKELFGQANLE